MSGRDGGIDAPAACRRRARRCRRPHRPRLSDGARRTTRKHCGHDWRADPPLTARSGPAPAVRGTPRSGHRRCRRPGRRGPLARGRVQRPRRARRRHRCRLQRLGAGARRCRPAGARALVPRRRQPRRRLRARAPCGVIRARTGAGRRVAAARLLHHRRAGRRRRVRHRGGRGRDLLLDRVRAQRPGRRDRARQ